MRFREMSEIPVNISRSFEKAKSWTKDCYNDFKPPNYIIYYSNLLFPVLLRSENTRLTGAPLGIISTTEEIAIREMSSNGKLFHYSHPFLSNQNRGYVFFSKKLTTEEEKVHCESQFIKMISTFFLGENTLQNVSSKCTQLLRMDTTLSLLLTRAISLSPVETNNWTYQYYRDLTALVLRFSSMENHSFHQPSHFETTSYAKFLKQLIPFAQKRSKIWSEIPLHNAVISGFSQACVEHYLSKFGRRIRHSESNMVSFISDAIQKRFDNFKDLLDTFLSLRSDKALIEAIFPSNSFNEVNTVPNYLKAVYEYSLETNADFWKLHTESDRFLGYLESKSGPLYFYEFNRTQLIPEQLLMLHNHAKPLLDSLSLPATASIIAFRRKGKENYLSSIFTPQTNHKTPQPKNPWNFPYYVNSLMSQKNFNIEKPQWDELLSRTWLSNEELRQIGLNTDQINCTWFLLNG